MLHMVVISHNPESCGSHTSLRDQHAAALQRLGEVASTKGLTIQGQWVSPAAHTAWAVIDAPHAHSVMEAMMESGMMALWSTTIHPVVPMAGASILDALPQVP